MSDVQRHVVEDPRTFARVAERHTLDVDRSVGRSTAPGRSGTSAGVSSSSYSLLRPAPADWTVLNSCESCCTGSNRFDSVSRKKVTTPIVIASVWTIQPPMPTAIAVVNTPANSMIGRYQAEIRTESMWAS